MSEEDKDNKGQSFAHLYNTNAEIIAYLKLNS
jgi:hypothetical protein